MLLLISCAAVARERQAGLRNLYLSRGARDEAPSVYVAGGVATVLRFEKPCDAARTKLLGWEGRFEPLVVGGKSVVLVPLLDLVPDDRFLLLVTLTDGTEWPFTVTAREERADGQVNVFPEPESPDAIRAALADARARERRLQEENERFHQEETSINHAFAALLVGGAVKQTPFRQLQKWRLKGDGVRMEVQVLGTKEADKTAVLFLIENQDPAKPWKLSEARLSTQSTWEAKPFALRASREAIDPGATGQIAVVMDASAFESRKGMERLVLELFRDDGLRQAYVLLELQTSR